MILPHGGTGRNRFPVGTPGLVRPRTRGASGAHGLVRLGRPSVHRADVPRGSNHPPTPFAAFPPDLPMTPSRPVDVGLTDALDPILGDRLGPALERIDARAGARLDDDGVHVRRLLRTTHVPWERISSIRLDSRLDLVLSFGVGLLPVTRLPVIGPVIETAADRAVDQLTHRLVPGLRARAGWAVATVEQQTWRRDVEFHRAARVVVLLYPAVTHRLVEEANSRGIPVIRDDGGPSSTQGTAA